MRPGSGLTKAMPRRHPTPSPDLTACASGASKIAVSPASGALGDLAGPSLCALSCPPRARGGSEAMSRLPGNAPVERFACAWAEPKASRKCSGGAFRLRMERRVGLQVKFLPDGPVVRDAEALHEAGLEADAAAAGAEVFAVVEQIEHARCLERRQRAARQARQIGGTCGVRAGSSRAAGLSLPGHWRDRSAGRHRSRRASRRVCAAVASGCAAPPAPGRRRICRRRSRFAPDSRRGPRD